MLRLLAGLLALVLALACIGLLVALIDVSGLALCDDPEAVRASGSDDCIEGSSAGKAIGLALGGAATAVAAYGSFLAVGYTRRRQRGAALAACAVATPLLALGAVFLLPVSF